jgi:hypothetical protein
MKRHQILQKATDVGALGIHSAASVRQRSVRSLSVVSLHVRSDHVYDNYSMMTLLCMLTLSTEIEQVTI